MNPYYEKFRRYASNDIGIDLGTANTLVYVRGKGIVINEPSVVALNQKTGQVVAVGHQAKNMIGRTPGHIIAIKPLVGGVISDFEVTEEMIAHLIRRAESGGRKMLGPRVLVGIPCGVTNVEARAVRDATKNNGAREVVIVEQPMAAAIGIRLPVSEPVGNFIIDIGGGTTDIAVISLGGIVRSKTLKIAGDRLNNDIIAYVRNEFKILIGEKTAENVKISIGSVTGGFGTLETALRGRDLITGLPREVVLTDGDVREAIGQSMGIIIESVKEVIETTPPEIIGDVMHRGIYITGGGALIRGLSEVLADEVKAPVYVSDDPLTAVARGTGIILENLENYKDILIEHENALPPAS
ncbi:MAG: rod shape-determining protein [Candidatus Taylorbacteria bacterium RIFCSPLOWO2_02_FULL_43_11]|uniref:Cell shape-determining protein MreB n=1 Tax=Candidatus Taylorbacteria bacterium RIFCSPHIGHO2_02_FULL_43_32b TaxID=1802306 RepID=A0A1G2MK45_9BACT|nr:MAG: rod shape-determining protein [Candidatus Taylorbacteria bacterium RIFCSPHIGHO2_01_FULL_43_47]OHA23391.1 MAG: rod shape-determining protein [Candidatus Taylorbacteria bacterium RIFCSPHIGHO2_02_FULL_43_32b]OHA30258.1 MAG: rod shape-determining protein [Candidatus Taylorbacteria bacterium RIFCSPLOWO2_01_FULL_43_44]OHA36878.1 MAG: rod shape-determining protein [Candidatus Taylorbacteria bacterium RIFCSPLOWO2_02_FULL_43_11]